MVVMILSLFLVYKFSDCVFVGGFVNVNYGFFLLMCNVDDNDVKEKDNDWVMSYCLGLLMVFID